MRGHIAPWGRFTPPYPTHTVCINTNVGKIIASGSRNAGVEVINYIDGSIP